MLGLFLDDERFPNQVRWVDYAPDIEWVRCPTPYNFTDLINDEDSVHIFDVDQ